MTLLNGLALSIPLATHVSGSTLDLVIAGCSVFRYHWYTAPLHCALYEAFTLPMMGSHAIRTDHIPLLTVYEVPVHGPPTIRIPPS